MKKIMMILILVIFFKVTSDIKAQQSNSWTTQDTILQLSYTTITLLDGLQTKKFIKNDTGRELNPVVGPNPSQKKINSAVFTVIILHAGVSYILPKKYRHIWQYIFIGVEGHTVYYNHLKGTKVNFGLIKSL